MLVAPSAIAAAIETSAIPRSISGDVTCAFVSARWTAAGEPGLVGVLAEQDRAGVADQPCPVCGDLQCMIPPVCCMAKEPPDWKLLSVVTRNLPGPGRSSSLDLAVPGPCGRQDADALVLPAPDISAMTAPISSPCTGSSSIRLGRTKPQTTHQ
jgi:hypothetical protein